MDILCVYGLHFICSKSDFAISVSFIVSGKTKFIAMHGMKSESKILLPMFSVLQNSLRPESTCDIDRSVYSKINQVTY